MPAIVEDYSAVAGRQRMRATINRWVLHKAFCAAATVGLSTSLFAGVCQAGAYVESPTLPSAALSSTQRGVSQLLLQNLAGDDSLDLLLIRNTHGTPGLAIWERRDLPNGETFVLDQGTAGAFVLDAQGLYVPGGVAGASRDLAVLVLRETVDGAIHSVQFVRNEGPGSRPRFGRQIALLEVPAALRLHYFPGFPIPFGQPGYLAYPLIASTGDERLWLMEVGDDGSVIRQAEALRHPGGAVDVLVFREPLANTPAFMSLGAFPPRLWRRDGDGRYNSQTLDLPGLVASDRVVKGLMAEFHNDGIPDLVLALADGRVLRWDGAGPLGPGQPISFGAVQPVASGLNVHDMVELGVPYRDAQLTPQRRTGILLAAQPESRFYDTDISVGGRPFVAGPQRYAAARAVAGEFGLNVAYLGRIDAGVLALEYNPDPAPVPNTVGWTDLVPLAVASEGGLSGTLLAVSSDAPLRDEVRVGAAATERGGACVEPSEFLSFHPGEQLLISKYGLFAGSQLGDEFDLCLFTEFAPNSPVREPRRRPAVRVPVSCPLGCLLRCLNEDVPFAVIPGKASKQLVDPAGVTLLQRFRDEVLAGSAKGRDYSAMYAEFSDDAYRSLVTAPFALSDLVRARDAWLPAITAWVNGDASSVIDQNMLDTLDLVAQHFITLGSPDLAATIRDQYQRLDPPSLLGQTIGDLETRFEQSVPTRGILRSGFEAGEPGN